MQYLDFGRLPDINVIRRLSVANVFLHSSLLCVKRVDTHIIILPWILSEEIITQYDGMDHASADRTVSRIHQHYAWYGITAYVKIFVSFCSACQHAKHTRTAHSKYFDLEVGTVMDQVSIDVCGPFATTRDGNSVLLVAVDHFSP